jgi:hypothetical protein
VFLGARRLALAAQFLFGAQLPKKVGKITASALINPFCRRLFFGKPF